MFNRRENMTNILNNTGKRNENDGYEKRVHHDVLIPQQIFYDEYHKLKVKYKYIVTLHPFTVKLQ
jgi:hypothetical protein